MWVESSFFLFWILTAIFSFISYCTWSFMTTCLVFVFVLLSWTVSFLRAEIVDWSSSMYAFFQKCPLLALSQEGRQAIHCFSVLFCLAHVTGAVFMIYKVRLRIPRRGHLYRGLALVLGFCRAACPALTAHLALELVCMKGPIQIHGFCGRSHSASDAVHVVIVVDSLDAERSRVRGLHCDLRVKRSRVNANPSLLIQRAQPAPFVSGTLSQILGLVQWNRASVWIPHWEISGRVRSGKWRGRTGVLPPPVPQ